MANYSMRLEDSLKKECETLFAELGMSMSTAITVFLRQSLRMNGIPFEITMDAPNKTTRAAMDETERMISDPSAPRYDSVDEAWEALNT